MKNKTRRREYISTFFRGNKLAYCAMLLTSIQSEATSTYLCAFSNDLTSVETNYLEKKGYFYALYTAAQ